MTLQDVTYGVGLAELQGELLAFADVDANNFVDLFAVGERGMELQAWLWQGPVGQGGDGAAFAAPAHERRAEVAGVVGLIPGDFDGDGVLDAVAMTRYATGAGPHGTAPHSRGGGGGASASAPCPSGVDPVLLLLCHSSPALSCAPLPMPDPKEEGLQAGLVRVAGSQVMALDLDGDMRTDLLGALLDLDPISGDCRAAGVAVWKNQGNGSFELVRDPLGEAGAEVEAEAGAGAEAEAEAEAAAAEAEAEAVEAVEAVAARLPTEGVRLASPHSSAQVDLDGDCVADLMLVTLPQGATEASCAHQARGLHHTILHLVLGR